MTGRAAGASTPQPVGNVVSRHAGTASRCRARTVGIVGCGAWAETGHLPALRSLPGVEVVACVGVDGDEGKAFADRHGIPHAFESLEALLAWGGAEAVTIAAPDHLHAPGVLAALRAGIPVYCEKPLTNSVDVAFELASAQAAAAVPATVGYSFRYSSAIRQLQEDLAEGRLGEPWLLELYEYNSQFHPHFGKPMNWKGDPSLAGGGALFEYGSHALDLALWLVGPIKRVTSQLCRVLPGALLDDLAVVMLEPARGGAATMTCGWVLAGAFPGIRLRLHGSEGAAEAVLNEHLPGGEEYRRLQLDGASAEPVALPPTTGRHGYVQRHLADFLSHEQNDADSSVLPSLYQGALVQQVLEAAVGATERWLDVEDAAPRSPAPSPRAEELVNSQADVPEPLSDQMREMPTWP